MLSRKKISFCYYAPPRQNENNGESYHFVSTAEFKDMIQKGELAEYATYCGNYYGTPLNALKEALNKDVIYLLEIEVQGRVANCGKISGSDFHIFTASR